MKKIIWILRILFVVVMAALTAFVAMHQKPAQTNILKAILTNSQHDDNLIRLSNRQSGRINIIFEDDDAQRLGDNVRIFKDKLDKNVFRPSNVDVKKVLDTYMFFEHNLLSEHTHRLLKDKDFVTVKLQSYDRLYNPVGYNPVPVEYDPFLLFIDYLQGLGSESFSGQIEFDGKIYEIFSVKIRDDLALSPTLLNVEVKKLIDLKDSFANEKTKIYLSGAPVHTYYASSKSINEINIICILSSLFIIVLCRFYFKSFKILVPIFLSLALGMGCGYLVTSVFFDSIHILTFVFSTTLIGICVDYSLHYFAHNRDLKSIIKSLTESLLTTVCAFVVLFASGITLLKQISLFTISGLVTVYLFVVLFYPLICKKINFEHLQTISYPVLSAKVRYSIIVLCFFATVTGLFRVNFNDDIKDMYVPPKNLAAAEKLYNDLQGNNFNYSFILVKGRNNQELLEKEETIIDALKGKDFNAYSLSRFVPSIKRQKENQWLRKELYKKELNSYAYFLPESARNKLLHMKYPREFLTVEKLNLPILKEFFIDKNTTVIIINGNFDKRFLPSGVNAIDLKNDISHRVSVFRTTCIKLFAPAALILYLILCFIYSPKAAFKITLPSILGGLFSIALLGLFNQCVNLFHILAMFLIIGFSMDYSIFRFNGSKNTHLSNTESAVLISCATSVFSFFLLSMTSFKLISSLGFVLAFGLVSSYILSVLLISTTAEEQTDNM